MGFRGGDFAGDGGVVVEDVDLPGRAATAATGANNAELRSMNRAPHELMLPTGGVLSAIPVPGVDVGPTNVAADGMVVERCSTDALGSSGVSSKFEP